MKGKPARWIGNILPFEPCFNKRHVLQVSAQLPAQKKRPVKSKKKL